MSDPYDVDLTLDSESLYSRRPLFRPRIMTARHVCPIPRSPRPHLNGSSGFTEDPPPPRNRCSPMPAIAGREQGRALLHVTRLRGDNTRAARTCIRNVIRANVESLRAGSTHPSVRPSIHPSIRPSIERSIRASAFAAASRSRSLDSPAEDGELVRRIRRDGHGSHGSAEFRGREREVNGLISRSSDSPARVIAPNRADPLARRPRRARVRGVRLVRRPRSVGIGARRRMKRRIERTLVRKRFVVTSVRVERRDRC